MVELFRECPSPMTSFVIENLHGALTRVPVSATAVPLREPGYNFLITSVWREPSDTEENIDWTRSVFAEMEQYMVRRRYVNYLADDEVGEDPVRAAYGPNYDRLVEVKRRTTRPTSFASTRTSRRRASTPELSWPGRRPAEPRQTSIVSRIALSELKRRERDQGPPGAGVPDGSVGGAGPSPFATIDEALGELRAGRLVVLVDDEERENEGDLAIAAEKATPEAINFMATHGRGLICLCLTEERCDELGLQQMTERNERPSARVHGLDRGARGRDDRDLGCRSVTDDPGGHRPDDEARGPGPARPRIPAPGARGGVLQPRRADRGGRRPLPGSRASSPRASSAR